MDLCIAESRVKDAARFAVHRAGSLENGMPNESMALKGGRCDSPMIVTGIPISRQTLSALAFM